MNIIEEDLRRIALQEERLQFDRFDAKITWASGVDCEGRRSTTTRCHRH